MTISKRSLLAAITMALVSMSLVVISTSAQARIKCWKNSDGVRECGKNVPPEYAQQGHEEINKRGITVNTSDRASTEEERAEIDRLAAIQEEEDKRKAQAAAQDKILLDTYSNTDDIQMTSDGKIAALESSVKLANKRKEKIQANLDKDTATAAAEELAGRQPSEDLLKDIKSLERQIQDLDKFIVDKHLAQEMIEKEYTEKIARYKELTGK
ncbi:MAG: hypothetical protein DRQ58_03675 [Gammaproteobacteria bacterium]|nr:MAG: hypothetical protein DRQ58_03675 [Gammaproteobacteria bacterium]